MMNNWKRNAVVATVLLFVCVGIYLNWSQQQKALETDLTDTLYVDALNDAAYRETLEEAAQEDVLVSMEDSFATIRLSRQQSRESAIELLQETISYQTEEETSAAQMQLEELVQAALMEAQIESMVVAKGYADCVVYLSEENVSIAVAAPEAGLQDADVAVLADLVTSQTDYEIADIRIIEVP